MHAKQSQSCARPNAKGWALKRSYSDTNSSFLQMSSTGIKPTQMNVGSKVHSTDVSSTTAINAFFQYPSMTYVKHPDHTPNVKTKEPQQFDMHLHPHL